jgi:hypothetical protein
MLDGHDSHEPEHRNDGHDRWLAMQSAYAEYKRASEALECTHPPAEDSSAGQPSPLAALEGQQRAAFERYLEARMEFLEFRFDKSGRQSADVMTVPMRDTEDSRIGSWMAFVKGRPVLQILAVILLCTTAFSLVREQKHVSDLEAARDELRATLNQTRDGLQQLAQKMDAWGPPQHTAIQPVEHPPRLPARRVHAATPRAAVRKPLGEAKWRHQTALHAQKQVASSQGVGARTYSERRRTRKPS